MLCERNLMTLIDATEINEGQLDILHDSFMKMFTIVILQYL